MNIFDYSPGMAGRHSRFVSAEKGCTHIGDNPSRQNIKQYKLDGEVFPPNTALLRCDYLLLNEERKAAYFIELKGSDISHAIAQIDSSVSQLQDSLKGFMIHPRIIYSNRTTKVRNHNVIKWLGRHPTAVIANIYYEEPIS